jgi:hypothetical protein
MLADTARTRPPGDLITEGAVVFGCGADGCSCVE